MATTSKPDKFGAGPVFSQCLYCRNYDGGRSRGAVCAAFPAGIPQAILSNEQDHRRPISGDGGVRFEPRPDVPADVIRALSRALDEATDR